MSEPVYNPSFPQQLNPVLQPTGTGYYAGYPSQPAQQVVVVTANRSPQSFVGHIVLACFVFWFCGCIFGLVAFILALCASHQTIQAPDSARKLGNASIGISVAGIVIAVIITILTLVFYLLYAQQESQNESYYGRDVHMPCHMC
jgi:heme/copper-type cytochrome/quinol oxidase subunit 2